MTCYMQSSAIISHMWQLRKPRESLAQLGRRLREQRISQSLTQAQLAKLAGVGSKSVSRIEDTGNSSTDTLLRILAALNIADRLDAVLPEATPSPLAMLQQGTRQKPRLRVRHKRKT